MEFATTLDEVLFLRAEIKRWRAAILKFSTHTDDCRYRGGHDCDCGLDELRSACQQSAPEKTNG